MSGPHSGSMATVPPWHGRSECERVYPSFGVWTTKLESTHLVEGKHLAR